jgi:hypothetical protein
LPESVSRIGLCSTNDMKAETSEIRSTPRQRTPERTGGSGCSAARHRLDELGEDHEDLVELVHPVLAQRDVAHRAEQVALDRVLELLAVPARQAAVVLLEHGAAGDAAVLAHDEREQLGVLGVLEARQPRAHGLGAGELLGGLRVVGHAAARAELAPHQRRQVAPVDEPREVPAQRDRLLDRAVVVPDERLQQVAELAGHEVVVGRRIAVRRGGEQEAALDQRVDRGLELEGRQVAEVLAARDVREVGAVALAAQEEFEQVDELLGEEAQPLAHGLLARHPALELAHQTVMGVGRRAVPVPERVELAQVARGASVQGGLQGHAPHGVVDCGDLPVRHSMTPGQNPLIVSVG